MPISMTGRGGYVIAQSGTTNNGGILRKSPLSYNDFYQEMQAKRPWSYEGVADKEDVYQTYRDSWQEMDTFNKTYKIWGEVESDDSDTASVENTPANREALLQ